MIELRITLDEIDYDTLIPTLIPILIKNPIAAKAALVAYKLKTAKLPQNERDVLAVQLLNDNKNKIVTKLSEKAANKGIKCSIVDFDASVK